uniref:Uncharacterized protein n=1 Tax=Cajanus cajan TaxID=3821 RepID=A0A151RNM5_CAJCA|nr:hypothetical protein KK1_034372 [Cajanus cajan]
MIQGARVEQYNQLRNYAEELLRSNPNSSIIIKCNMSNDGSMFERIYIYFEACKSSFVHTCRPLIGLDGCFLKRDYGGQLHDNISVKVCHNKILLF